MRPNMDTDSGRERLPKSNQNRESDFLKMSVSPRRRAHFEREGLAKPGQRGLEKPGQAREGQKGQTGGPGRSPCLRPERRRGFTRPLRMGLTVDPGRAD